MKKTISLILTIVILISSAVLLSGCNGGYQKVYSIKYSTSPHDVSLYSCFYFDVEKKEVLQSEYDSATNKASSIFYQGTINVDGTITEKSSSSASAIIKTVKDLKKLKGNTFYVQSGSHYYKVSYKKLILSYVEVKFYADGTLGIRHRNSDNKLVTVRVKAENYTITYFYD